MSDGYYNLEPPARFGTLASEGFGDYGAHPVRLFIANEGVAAVLDGLRIEMPDELLNLMVVAVAAITRPLHADAADPTEGHAKAPEFSTDLEVLGSRLPLAAKVMRDLRITAETMGSDFDSAASEERHAEIAEIVKDRRVTEFKVSKKERRILLRAARVALAERRKQEKAAAQRDELKLIIRDLKKKCRGEDGMWTLSSLPIPQLVYWMRPLMGAITGSGFAHVYNAASKEDEKRIRREHSIMRGAWVRLGNEAL